MDTYFSTVNDIIKNKTVAKRVQFALQDVVDLRDNQWVPRQRQNTKLKKAEHPWRRQAVLQFDLTEERKKTQDVFCKFRSILNRLTPQKLTKLVDATLQLKINTEERLRGVVDMIFTRVSYILEVLSPQQPCELTDRPSQKPCTVKYTPISVVFCYHLVLKPLTQNGNLKPSLSNVFW